MKHEDSAADRDGTIRALAARAAASLPRGGKTSCACAPRAVRGDLAAIKAAVRAASRYAREHVTLPAAFEWLLDNWYIAEREGKCAASELAAAKRLPMLGGRPNKLFVSACADAFTDACAREVTEARAEAFLEAFEDTRSLSEAERHAFLPAVRLSLVAALARESGTPGEAAAAEMERIFTSLRFLSGFDATGLLERAGRVERILRQDPVGVYAKMDDDTRAAYRREVSRLADRRGVSEEAAATRAVKLAARGGGHIGRYIFTKPLGGASKNRAGRIYIAAIAFLTALCTFLTCVWLRNPVISLLLLPPISEIVKNAADFFVLRAARGRRVHRLELRDGVPSEGRTLAAVSVLLTSREAGARAAGLLEEYWLANRDAGVNLTLGLLADLPESERSEEAGDAAIIAGASGELARLNAKYGGGFYLFRRERTENKRDGVFSGWERKRGAILELCRLLRGRGDTSFAETDAPKNVKYIIALDGDTRLNAGTARALIGAAMHPLNRPVLDAERGVVTEGSGMIQPRVSVGLTDAVRTEFTRVFAGQGGLDPYGGAASDLYQNLFGTGTFTGKGILDIDAYLACLDGRFPENTVLSHDLLEGAYLRCAFAGDIELTDSFPARPAAYYARMHRWVRGDWQNLPWLRRRVTDARGEVTENPIPAIDRWKIADNLRRSLVPVFTMASLFFGMMTVNASFAAAALIAALAAISELIIASAASFFGRRRAKTRYISYVLGGFGGRLAQTMLRLTLLPFEAFICISAIVTALYRMAVSRRRLLAWVTAADAEARRKNSVRACFAIMWPCVALSAAVILFTPFAPAAAVAVVWALSPLYVYALGRERRPRRACNAEDELFLRRCAGDIWRFFNNFLTIDDNFLPPDNFQEQPAVGLAHRTSPTNVGMALLSALAAVDLGACPRERAVTLIGNMLKTVQNLPKWRGHLYNWYDTETLAVLPPSYVSTVDSGNLAGCLLVLREGLSEWGEDALAETADRLLRGMEFAPLYDAKRQLFHIGYDAASNRVTESRYDLMASEAMQASYLAVARGDVPRRHWRALSRALVSKDGYRGMASWTGTMFEYLMPFLLLPCYRDSLLYESLKFCVYVQKKNAPKGRPWGSSESAFYAFDHTLSYRYKAHGAAALALRRGMERDDVVAPYASFLALAADPRGAVANLRKLAELGAVGRYGFFDAVDFTPSRRRARDFELVRTTMAHHAGMSLVAIDNLLRGNIMQKRFLSDRRMAAFTELLQEKVPVGGIVLRRAPHETPERARRAPSASWSWETDKINTLLPRCGLLSGGAYSVVMSETGQSSSTWNTVALTRAAFEQGGRDTGVAFFLKSGGELISLLPAPMYDGDVRYSAFLSGSLCRIGAKCGGIETVVTTAVPDSDAGELRVAEISSSSEREAELVCYFEPALSRLSDYASHPAFSKLSIETSFRDGMLVLKRRPRGRGRGLFLAFACDAPFEYDTSREDAVGRGGVEALGWALTRGAGGTAGAVLDPCVLARVKLSLAPGAAARVAFALAPGTSEDDAVSAAARILNIREPGGYSRLDETARAAALTPEQMNNAMALLPELVYPSPYRRVPEEYLPALKNGQSALWNLGVSGDLPILTAEIASEADCAAARELVLTHRLFSENGVSFDLLFLLAEGGDYRSPLRGVMSELLRAAGREGALSARGGVHLAQSAAPGADTSRAVSFRVLTPGERLEPRALTENTQIPPREFSRPESRREMKYGYNDDNSFSFEVCGELPRNAWSHVLANDRFGSLATDAGTGHLWHLNARENRLNAWKNDSLATEGTEKLELLTDGEKISLFAANDGRACRVTYGFGYAVWEKQIGDTRIKTTSFVPQDAAARVLLIERADGGELDVAYYTDVALSDGAGLSVNAVSRRDGGDICVQNPYNADFEDSVFTLTASAPPERFTCSKLGYLTGKLDGTTGAGFPPCIAAVYRASGALALVTGCDGAETLRSLATLHGARAALGETTAHWRELTSRITVTTPNENLNHYINGWAAYQTLCCRVLARTSLYQSGGAYGFRDQLQDICALIDVAPETAREQILRAAERQFEEGDVQHWWHPTARSGAVCDKGVRTRCSDDLLWLPYALCEYIERTGDGSLADAAARYIASPPLSEEETERYEQPAFSAVTEPLLSHAARALDLVTARGVGRHGLCLIGGGDWNDGMNLVGAGGEGESVWLTWFMSHTASRFAELLKARGDPGGAARYARAADTCARAAGRAWDGDWYLRGYFDNGAPLGSAENAECRIDSIAQSFAALGGGEPGRVKTALKNAVEILFDREGRVVKLFDPPFSDGGSMPGYIKGYSPGFRENGGQYTHGAVWLAMGLLLAGMNAEGWALLEALLPQGRPNGVYRTEPYVLAADVYAGEGHVGRGGWTWYTGASGWFLRVAAENLLGIRQRGGKLTVNPRLPPSWDGYTARVRYGGAAYSVTVKDGTAEIREDGKTLLPAP